MRSRIVTIARRRRGLCLALVAIMMPAFLGFAGLCVDIGVLALARAQLQTVADAAALAGAKQLANPQRVSATYDITSDLQAAQTRAIDIGQANAVLGQPAVVSSSDVKTGYTNTAVPRSAMVVTSSSAANSVQVTATRDAQHTGPVPAFFSKALRFSDTPLSVTSTATVQPYSIKGYKTSKSGMRTKLIPIALSLTTWNAMQAGLTTDTFTYANKKVTSAPDGIYESSLYPAGSGSGNLGTVNFNPSSNGTPILSDRITNGVTTDDLFASGSSSGGYYLLTPSVKASGNPGVSLGISNALQSLVGKIVSIPIYDPNLSSGNGANFQYTIVGFAPVVVLNVFFNGVHSGMIVQSALDYDPLAVVGTPQTWTTGGIVRLRLTQ